MADFEGTLDEHIRVVRSIDPRKVSEMASLLVATLRAGGKVLICGNGGSAADAQHFAAELAVRFETDRRALPAVAITTDTSALTAAANDFGYESAFSRQVEALARPGDAILCLSTSGRSGNVLRAIRTAREMGVATWAITGEGEGPVFSEADCALAVPGSTARVQEGTILVLHHLARAADAAF